MDIQTKKKKNSFHNVTQTADYTCTYCMQQNNNYQWTCHAKSKNQELFHHACSAKNHSEYFNMLLICIIVYWL